MANTDAPNGFTPAFHLKGGTIRLQKYNIASALAADIKSGDCVFLTGSGKQIDLVDAGTDTPIVGVFQGVRYRDTDGSYIYRKDWVSGTTTLNSDDAVAMVVDDPNVVFEVQASGSIAAADIGQQADIAYTAGSSLLGTSKAELGAPASGANFQIYDLVDRDDNEYGANAKVYVLINEHAYANAINVAV